MIKAIDQTQIPTWLGGTLDEGADPVQLNKLRMDPVISKTNKQTRRTKRRSVESKSNKARTANQRAIMSESGCISKTRVGSQSEFLIRGQHAEQNSAQRLVITSCYRPWTSTVSVAYRVLLSAFNWWIRFRGGGGEGVIRFLSLIAVAGSALVGLTHSLKGYFCVCFSRSKRSHIVTVVFVRVVIKFHGSLIVQPKQTLPYQFFCFGNQSYCPIRPYCNGDCGTPFLDANSIGNFSKSRLRCS